MNKKNLALFSALCVAMIFAFIAGGYLALMPLFFIAGLFVAGIAGAWVAVKTSTRFMALFLFFATLIAVLDEYAHTSAGTLAYFDHGIPSLLTVFGWGIFLSGILCIACLVMRLPAIACRTTFPEKHRITRILPALISSSLVATMVMVQGYVSLFTAVLFFIYVVLVTGACYYTYHQPLVWNFVLFIVSILFGGVMELFGSWDGLWRYNFHEPVSLFILFSWPLRVWTVLGLCHLCGSDIRQGPESATVNVV